MRVFPGRVIFDHLLKTGGLSLGAWLRETLGTGCVTPHVWGDHHDLIRQFGGLYSIISGHFQFFNRENLDPRYKYITCIREPIDRAISWIFYSLHDAPVNPNYDPTIKKLIPAFLQSDGAECPPILFRTLSNVYVDHFCSIGHDRVANDEARLSNALQVIQRYDVVGLFEDYSSFVNQVADLIEIEPPQTIAKRNVTSVRPNVDQISPALRARLVAWNQLDLRLYAEISEWLKVRSGDSQVILPHPSQLGWSKYERAQRVVSDPTGSLSAEIVLSTLQSNSECDIPVKITNKSADKWAGDTYHRLNASYHWLNQAGGMAILDGYRSKLPEEGIQPGEVLDFTIRVRAPGTAGTYTLILTLVQEGVCWFERKGFKPAKMAVNVT